MAQKTILLIDDEQGFLEALEHALVGEGYRVLKATDGQEALELLASTQIDLVTVDIMMSPGEMLEGTVSSQQTGVYLCKEIRRRYPRLGIFCISVVTNPETIRDIKA